MGEVLNLRQARKRKARDERERQAAENRATYGRSKAERAEVEASAKAAETFLDGHRRTNDERPDRQR